jgi:outer membrane biosynthesis protein TonB
MMQVATLRSEEKVALGVAVALHAALLAVLLLQPDPRDPPPIPERMTVNLTDEVGLTATAPDPVSESSASIAPTLSPEPSPPEPIPAAAPAPIPAPRPIATTTPPRPRQTARPQPRPRETASPTPRQTQRPAPRPTQNAGGSRIGDDFLAGSGDSTRTTETRTPASQIGASARASIVQAMAREIKPHWQPPNGPEVENIVTVLRFRLNEDGSLNGRPTMVRQTGVNDTNRAQAGRHAEQAIRAVQLAAPFDLPSEYYEAWRNVTAFSFDWRLAQ